MKNKYLNAWIISLILLGSSCKKQENLIQEKFEKKIQKTDLIGNWSPVKIETVVIDNESTKIIADSSRYVKSYVLGYVINSDHLIHDNRGSYYEISELNDQQFLEYELYGFNQKLTLLKLTKNTLILQHKNLIGTIKKTETIYFNKSK
ncbi:hypothetical protein DBR40_00785 [Pedobacter sp. KBW01]|uniref:hypothetical protein n=1 Tax=Pedobacter sp. KBW01 TaxID=2153364 RepID=UPI000F5A7094|nr:hypothetical protein [Pedobacter sp. KBW01]RQO80188.1 hypothetical protein DBR40_00785 [Pedobacter sp. KBW01]